LFLALIFEEIGIGCGDRGRRLMLGMSLRLLIGNFYLLVAIVLTLSLLSSASFRHDLGFELGSLLKMFDDSLPCLFMR